MSRGSIRIRSITNPTRRLFVHTDIIDPRSLIFSPWNTNSVSPEDQRKLEQSLKRNGQFRPIIVREVAEGLQVIGGEHTTRAILNLGWDEISVYNLGEMSDRQAKEISVLDNGRYGHDDAIELATLMAEIGEFEDLQTFMPFMDTDLTAIFANHDIDLNDLDFDPDDEPEEAPSEAPPKTHQIMRFKVPIGDAELVERRVKAVINQQDFKGEDSLENAGDALVYIVTKWSPDE